MLLVLEDQNYIKSTFWIFTPAGHMIQVDSYFPTRLKLPTSRSLSVMSPELHLCFHRAGSAERFWMHHKSLDNELPSGRFCMAIHLEMLGFSQAAMVPKLRKVYLAMRFDLLFAGPIFLLQTNPQNPVAVCLVDHRCPRCRMRGLFKLKIEIFWNVHTSLLANNTSVDVFEWFWTIMTLTSKMKSHSNKMI